MSAPSAGPPGAPEASARAQELIERVRELEQLYAAAPVGFCVLDADLRYQRINDRLAELNGVPAAEHLGRTVAEVMPRLAEHVVPLMQRVLATGEPSIDHEMRRATLDEPEVERDWLISYYPLRSAAGSVRGLGVIVQEVTEVKRAERALAESERRLRTVIDNADLVLWAIDREGRFTLSVGRGLEKLGLAAGEVVGESLFAYYADYPQILDLTRRALAGESVSAIVRVGDLYYDARYLPMTDERGAPHGAIGVALDATDRERAFGALRESQQRFFDIADNIREIFWLFDIESRSFVYQSPAFETVTGLSLEDVYNDSGVLFGAIHPEDRERMMRALDRLAEAGERQYVEHRLLRPDGKTRLLAVRFFSVPDESGRIRRAAGVTEDITKQRQAEEERRQLEDQIRQTQKLESLGLLAGGIAHDFNNLLVGVLGNADLALLGLPPDSTVGDHVRKIKAAAERASELANQMLAYSGKGPFVVEPVDLNRLVGEMAHLLESSISKKTGLSLELSEGLGTIEADPSQLRQIVMNLITNAAEATEEDGWVRVRTSMRLLDEASLRDCDLGGPLSPGPYVCLEVTDNGCGMEEEVRDRIFDPFFTTKFEGRGLGLAAVLGIVRRHGGALRVSSRPGSGTTFSVFFQPATTTRPATSVAARSTEAPAGCGRILVVDDEEAVRQVARAMLESGGYQVEVAADGKEAVAMYAEKHREIDLVLLDLTMPGLDGRQVYEEMRQIRPDVRVVLSSGYSGQEVAGEFDSASRLAFLHKPYRLSTLLETVGSLLGQGSD